MPLLLFIERGYCLPTFYHSSDVGIHKNHCAHDNVCCDCNCHACENHCGGHDCHICHGYDFLRGHSHDRYACYILQDIFAVICLPSTMRVFFPQACSGPVIIVYNMRLVRQVSIVPGNRCAGLLIVFNYSCDDGNGRGTK